MARVLAMRFIKLYQVYISPLKPPTCRFCPSCSHYTYEAFSRFGWWRGIRLSARRLLRCGPWHPGGYDPLPEE